LPEEKVFINLERYGNTSAASIPVALCEALESGRAKEGDTLVLVGFGGGLTWAAATLQLGVAERTAWYVPLFSSRPIEWPVTGVRERVRSAAGTVASMASSLLLPLFARSNNKK
jgi:hypothetical protein